MTPAGRRGLQALLCLAGGVAAVGPVPAAPSRTTLVCDAVYLPARASWTRTVTIEHDPRRVRGVHIDGVPVYGFAVEGTVIFTALDNERIQVDTAARTWTSDFRGQATGQGRCERVAP